jgi:hypothetical protein
MGRMTDSAWRPNSRLQIIFADADCQFGSRQKAKICADFCSAALSAWWVYGAANENSANAKRQTTVSPATQAITTPPQTLRIAARIGAGSRFSGVAINSRIWDAAPQKNAQPRQ